jgi:NADPH:quinone reductase-like Zn-dependent oxidoreductase
MKAAIRRKYCSPDKIQIEDIDQPKPKDSEVLIKVFATTVNRTDCANLTAKPFIMRFVLGFFKPRKIILGTDFAGEVVSVGKNVTAFKVGDRVFGFNDIGNCGQAEYLVLPESGNILPIPDGVAYDTAVASLEGAHYAYSFIHKVKIESGQKVMVNGATGAIGSALLQFVNLHDVEISATSNSENVDLIKSLGATKVYDYTKEDFTQSDEKYDYVFDAVGKSTFGKCKPILKDHGVYISSELGPYAQNLFFASSATSASKKRVIFPFPYSIKTTMPYISTLLKDGSFKPVIDRRYQLENIAEAYSYAMAGKKTGALIVAMK